MARKNGSVRPNPLLSSNLCSGEIAACCSVASFLQRFGFVGEGVQTQVLIVSTSIRP